MIICGQENVLTKDSGYYVVKYQAYGQYYIDETILYDFFILENSEHEKCSKIKSLALYEASRCENDLVTLSVHTLLTNPY